MNIKQLFSNKKFKNVLFTICEILIVAGIIFGALMFIYGKINKESARKGGIDNTVVGSDKNTPTTASDNYYIEVNIKKSALIVYEYSKDKKTKEPYKIFKCSVGSDVSKGKHKISGHFLWMGENGNWHKYNSEFGYKARIQSAEYSDKYEYTLKQKSYNTIGTKQVSGKSIMLYSKDAQWIYEHCKDKTVINIIKGGKNDKLPLEFEQTNPLLKHCNWDPTDSSKSNPYRKAQNGKIILGTSTLTVERGATPNYLANLIAKDENGKDVSSMVKYKKINTDSTGTYKVTYTYKTAAGIKLEAVQKIKVVDTTPPKVVCSKDLFQYEVTSLDKKDLNTDANVKAIESMVRSTVSCNESGVKITVTCARKNELSEGKNPVTVTAEDSAGNVGAYNVQCEITIKKVKPGKPYKPTKEQQELINRRKEESKRNNKKDSDKKKDSSDKKKTEAATKSDKGNSEKETSKKSSDKKEDETIVNE